MIFLTSDFHLSHNRDFVYAARGFASVEEMNETIVKRFNEVVSPDDIVYILGDLCLGGGSEEVKQENKRLIESLNGDLKVVLGNHDTPARVALYQSCRNVQIFGFANMIQYKKYHFYLSHYPSLTSNWDDDKSLKQRVINLCGHSHYTDPLKDMDKGPIYHVECDAHNCYPVALDKIIEDMKIYLDKAVK